MGVFHNPKGTGRKGRLPHLVAVAVAVSVVTAVSCSSESGPDGSRDPGSWHLFVGEWAPQDGTPSSLIIDELGYVSIVEDDIGLSSRQPSRLDDGGKSLQVEMPVPTNDYLPESRTLSMQGRLVTENNLVLEVSGHGNGGAETRTMTMVFVRVEQPDPDCSD